MLWRIPENSACFSTLTIHFPVPDLRGCCRGFGRAQAVGVSSCHAPKAALGSAGASPVDGLRETVQDPWSAPHRHAEKYIWLFCTTKWPHGAEVAEHLWSQACHTTCTGLVMVSYWPQLANRKEKKNTDYKASYLEIKKKIPPPHLFFSDIP